MIWIGFRIDKGRESNEMRKILLITVSIFLLSLAGVSPAVGEVLSIFDIQYSTTPYGESPMHGEVVDCLGGIVSHKRTDSRPRLILQDPIIRDPNIQNANCFWGAIQVKDWWYDSFDDVVVGDWVEFTNVTVEDSRGTTFLQYWNANPDSSMPGFAIVSSGNPVPEPVTVSIDEIVSPVEDLHDPGCWYVGDHRSEKYESMRIRIRDVTVTDMGNGKASDNYTLQSYAVNDPNFSCWTADYMNDDAVGLYHVYVEIGRSFCRVQGILEQYKNLSTGWDYYQLLTTKTEDFSATQPGDLDDDCDVDLGDYGQFSKYWQAECPFDPNLCGGADMLQDGVVDAFDLRKLVYYWLDGTN